MIAQTNAFIVVLDACVLAPMPLCDTLLRLAKIITTEPFAAGVEGAFRL